MENINCLSGLQVPLSLSWVAPMLIDSSCHNKAKEEA